MASSNEGDGGVLRRMVKMVASPARDLMGLGSDSGGNHFADTEKAELKAMIERKRRNDFVRKRELNMLRRIRREGLTAEQAAALEATSRMGLDDSEVRPTQPPGGADRGVKAKIDAIEKQMVGPGSPPVTPRPPAMTPVSVRSELYMAMGRRTTEPTAPEITATVPAGLVTENIDDCTRPMMMMPADELPLQGEPVRSPPAAGALERCCTKLCQRLNQMRQARPWSASGSPASHPQTAQQAGTTFALAIDGSQRGGA